MLNRRQFHIRFQYKQVKKDDWVDTIILLPSHQESFPQIDKCFCDQALIDSQNNLMIQILIYTSTTQVVFRVLCWRLYDLIVYSWVIAPDCAYYFHFTSMLCSTFTFNIHIRIYISKNMQIQIMILLSCTRIWILNGKLTIHPVCCNHHRGCFTARWPVCFMHGPQLLFSGGSSWNHWGINNQSVNILLPEGSRDRV